MDFLSGLVGEGIKSLLKTILKEIKHLTNLPDDAERLRQEIDRVKGIVDHINTGLSGRGQQALPVVRNWLNREEQIVKFAEEVFLQYEQSKHRRLCWCCPHCLLVPQTSREICNYLAEIDDLLKMRDSDFPKNEELGALPGTLVQPTENELVGKVVHEKPSELERWLLKDDSVRVVGVYGMPGMGKTSLLKQFNNNKKVVNFFKLVIWVTVSRESDISALQRRIF
ncbi:hypothetical protein SUGI_0134290 [Cryptomeria japonica]|nr:hypothetical protein SUGI_0134290 [Cryptomeria japonica]